MALNMREWFQNMSESYSTVVRTHVEVDNKYADEVGYIWGCLEKKFRELTSLPARGGGRRFDFEMGEDKIKILDDVLADFFETLKSCKNRVSVRKLKGILDGALDMSSLNSRVVNQQILAQLQATENSTTSTNESDKANNGKMSTVEAGKSLYGTVLCNKNNNKGESYHLLVVGGGRKIEITNPSNMKTVTCTPPLAVLMLDGPDAGMCGTLHSLFRKLGVANNAKNMLLNSGTIGKFAEWADKNGVSVSKYLDIFEGKSREIPGTPWDQNIIQSANEIVRQADCDGWTGSIHSYCKHHGCFHEAHESNRKEAGSDVKKTNVLEKFPKFCAMSGAQGVQGAHSHKPSVSHVDFDGLLSDFDGKKTKEVSVTSVEESQAVKETSEVVRSSEEVTPMMKDLRGLRSTASAEEARVNQLEQENEKLRDNAWKIESQAEIRRLNEAAVAAEEITKLKMENKDLLNKMLTERNRALEAMAVAFKTVSA